MFKVAAMKFQYFQKILSLDCTNHIAEINTVDAQKSYKEGLTVLVTGCLTGNDNSKRKFVQSFFLAPQDNGCFVLIDVFRYVEVEKHKVNGVHDAPRVPSTPEPGKVLLFSYFTFPYVLLRFLSIFF